MSKITYKTKRFRAGTLEIIEKAEQIINEHANMGFDLTLRQLYYQFVQSDSFPEEWRDKKTGSKNIQSNYDKLGSIISNARLAGMIDWNSIVDRTRQMKENGHWISPSQMIRAYSRWYELNKWIGQPYRVEVWIEKDALIGVIEGICRELDIPRFSCRGYTSQSEMWRAGKRLKDYHKFGGATPVILHLGDHDPSGIDMTRDIRDRLLMFSELEDDEFIMERIALNMDQIEEYNPPPNPTKLTDSRAEGYISDYGNDSWELDALNPQVMSQLISDKVYEYMDEDLWDEVKEKEERHKSFLSTVCDRWEDIIEFLDVE